MNIAIMRTFARLREITAHHKDIPSRVEKPERGPDQTGSVIEVLVEDIDKLSREIELMKAPHPRPKQKIGYILHDD